ncbi:hypothetical protein ACIP88_09520 [Streptomyces uncialis]|uniref:hypothetical protein n=1 Tax=Streptomyces uncialis TaxID=1048205 RepID=UPI003802C6BB
MTPHLGHLTTRLYSGSAAAVGGTDSTVIPGRLHRAPVQHPELLLGVSAHNGPVFAAAVDTEPGRIAEGGFLIAVSLPSVAQTRGWPVRPHLDLDRTAPADRTLGQGPLTYLAAEAHAELVRVLVTGDRLPVTIAAAGPGPHLTVLPAPTPTGSR